MGEFLMQGAKERKEKTLQEELFASGSVDGS
jgi:hypothetical protein